MKEAPREAAIAPSSKARTSAFVRFVSLKSRARTSFIKGKSKMGDTAETSIPTVCLSVVEGNLEEGDLETKARPEDLSRAGGTRVGCIILGFYCTSKNLLIK